MVPYLTVFPDAQQANVTTDGRNDLPDATYVFSESYCDEAQCECRRVLLHVVDMSLSRVVATINYAFDPPEPPFDDEGQWFLDPINPQSAWSEPLLDIFEDLILRDDGYHEHLEEHYEAFKAVVRNPDHPAHGRLPPPELDVARPSVNDRVVTRAATKVGRNEPCPCGSGRKYKKCCGA